MIEPLRVNQWIYETLSGDATIASLVGTRIYEGLAPQGAALPFVVFQFMAGADVVAVGAVRVMNSGLYQVKAICQGESYSPAAAIADRIDTLLQGANGSVSDGVIYGCTREQPLTLIEQEHGIQYRHVGGLYRVYAQEM